MNTAIIFAGGTGTRMHNMDTPKQFLEVGGVPIIIRTLKHFSDHPFVDNIIVVCIESWINRLNQYICKYKIKKIIDVIPGGVTGFDSIHNGLLRAEKTLSSDDIVLLCDGVRPILSESLISNCIIDTHKYGTAVPVTQSIDSVLFSEDGVECDKNISRKKIYITQAPQGYKFNVIMSAHNKAVSKGMQPISSADLLLDLGEKVHMFQGIRENIKVTTLEDLNIIRATEYYEQFKRFSKEELYYGE